MKKIIALVIIVCLLFLFTQDIYLGSGKYKRWFDVGAGSLLPDPSSVLGREVYQKGHWSYNSYDGVDGQVYDVSHDEFEKYVDAVFNCGFKVKFFRDDDSFSAYHLNVFRNRRVYIYWWKNYERMSISIN